MEKLKQTEVGYLTTGLLMTGRDWSQDAELYVYSSQFAETQMQSWNLSKSSDWEQNL